MTLFTGTLSDSFESDVVPGPTSGITEVWKGTFAVTISIDVKSPNVNSFFDTHYYNVHVLPATIDLIVVNVYNNGGPLLPSITYSGPLAPDDSVYGNPIVYYPYSAPNFSVYPTFIFQTSSLLVSAGFEGNWNQQRSMISGPFNIVAELVGSGAVDTSLGAFTLTLGGSEHKCHFDLNKDGKSTGNELAYSDCSERLELADKKIANLNDLLTGMQALLDDLKASVNDLNLDDLISTIGHVTKAILNYCGEIGEALSLGYTVGTAIRDIFIEHKPVGGVVLGAWSDILGVFTKIAKLTKVVTPNTGELLNDLAGLVDTGNEAFSITDKSEAVDVLNMLSQQIIHWEGTLGTIKLQLSLWEQERDAAYKCVHHLNAKLPAKVAISHSDPATWGDQRVTSTLPVVADLLASNKLLAKVSGGTSTTGKIIIVPDVYALHDPAMPDGFNIGFGRNTSDVIHATGSDLQGTSSACLLRPGAGNDRILVSSGAIYIQDPGGTDSVFVYDATAHLASINDITFKQVDALDPGFVMFGVGLNLFVETQGIENFTFSEGTYHLVNGELQFQAGDQNALTLTGTKYGDTIHGGSQTEIIDGLGGNDHLFGGDGNDVLNGGTGNDIIEGGKGADQMHGGDGIDTLSYSGSDAGVFITFGSNGEINSASGGHATGDTGDGFENITGSAFSDNLTGNALANVLKGGAGNDILTGGGGRDTMYGGLDADTFVFNAVSDSGNTTTTRDIIKDFAHLEDKIDLSAIDAVAGGSDDPFSFLGTAAFSGAAGQLRFAKTNAAGTAHDVTIVQADLDGDKHVDFQIELTGLKTLTAADFVL